MSIRFHVAGNWAVADFVGDGFYDLGKHRDNGAADDLQLAIQSADWLVCAQHAAGPEIGGAFPFAVDDDGPAHEAHPVAVVHPMVRMTEVQGLDRRSVRTVPPVDRDAARPSREVRRDDHVLLVSGDEHAHRRAVACAPSAHEPTMLLENRDGRHELAGRDRIGAQPDVRGGPDGVDEGPG